MTYNCRSPCESHQFPQCATADCGVLGSPLKPRNFDEAESERVMTVLREYVPQFKWKQGLGMLHYVHQYEI